jgi:hypothetical protein
MAGAKVSVASGKATGLELTPASAKLSSTVTNIEAATTCGVKGAILNLNSG